MPDLVSRHDPQPLSDPLLARLHRQVVARSTGAARTRTGEEEGETMNKRGILFRPHPRGTQREPGGQRGDWWVSFMCADGHRHCQKIGPKGVAREEHGRIRARVRREGYWPAKEQRGRPILLAICSAW
jgi:hypothetical protein